MVGAELFPQRYYLLADPDVTVARAGLGLTLYLDDSRYWFTGGAAYWFKRFLKLIDETSFNGYPIHYTTSLLNTWRPIRPESLEALAKELTVDVLGGHVRHLFEFRLADDPGAPRFGFGYREADSERSTRTGHLQIFLSNDFPSNELLSLAIEVGHEAPIFCGVGGWLARWNPNARATAFKHIHAWCRRYLGLDVQVPDRMSYFAREALPGVNWLTLIGAPLWRLIEDVSDLRGLPDDIAALHLSRSILVRAGEEPELGDCNQLDYPRAISEAARRLDAGVVREPPCFPGVFEEEAGATAAWLRRFIFPEDWR